MHAHDQQLLADTLAAACTAPPLARAHASATELEALCSNAGPDPFSDALDEPANRVASMDLPEIADLIRVATAHFHLLNKAEQLNIIRVNHTREIESESGAPRPESIDDAVARLGAAGLDAPGSAPSSKTSTSSPPSPPTPPRPAAAPSSTSRPTSPGASSNSTIRP